MGKGRAGPWEKAGWACGKGWVGLGIDRVGLRGKHGGPREK